MRVFVLHEGRAPGGAGSYGEKEDRDDPSHAEEVSYRLGSHSKPEELIAATADNPQWSDACERLRAHLSVNGIDLKRTPATLGPCVTMDPSTEEFVGEFAERANTLSQRDDREPFVVPENV